MIPQLHMSKDRLNYPIKASGAMYMSVPSISLVFLVAALFKSRDIPKSINLIWI